MKARIMILALLMAVVCRFAAASQDQDVKSLIEDVKKTEYGREFLKTHSEENLEKVILFTRDPVRYFPEIRNLGDCFGYIAVCDVAVSKAGNGNENRGAFDTLLDHLRSADDETAPIWTFLLEKADGFYAESLASHYTRLFKTRYDVLTRGLKKSKDWRQAVHPLPTGDWQAFKEGLAKLGNSDFEAELKQYVFDLTSSPSLPSWEVANAYWGAAQRNVLAAVNPKVFFGYWSVCADGQGFGYGYTYPSLDGHQMTDALLWLGRIDIVKANWDYVRSFQRPDGSLPIAILPNLAGKQAGEGDHMAPVAANGGLYAHWVPGNPLQALADPTYIQNADDIFRMTVDLKWLTAQIHSVNLSADHLASLVDDAGAVRGAGYYVERPARIEYDGVTQCHAVDAFRRVAALNRVAGDAARAEKYENLAERIRRHFVSRFWVKEKGQFAEYDNPRHGLISSHGLTDVDWAAIALDVASPEQVPVLWPKLRYESGFYYGGMPTGIATRPDTYEDWEFTYTDRHDLAAMGRVWYLDAQARARMGDAEGLLGGIRRVSEEGAKNGYYWRERYQPDGKGGVKAAGPNTYCEYPANLIRIVQRFLLGVNMGLDGSVVLAPTVTDEFWRQGFGQTLRWRGRVFQYHMQSDRISGTYEGRDPQKLGVRLNSVSPGAKISAIADNLPLDFKMESGLIFVTLPETAPGKSCQFEIIRIREK